RRTTSEGLIVVASTSGSLEGSSKTGVDGGVGTADDRATVKNSRENRSKSTAVAAAGIAGKSTARRVSTDSRGSSTPTRPAARCANKYERSDWLDQPCRYSAMVWPDPTRSRTRNPGSSSSASSRTKGRKGNDDKLAIVRSTASRSPAERTIADPLIGAALLASARCRRSSDKCAV